MVFQVVLANTAKSLRFEAGTMNLAEVWQMCNGTPDPQMSIELVIRERLTSSTSLTPVEDSTIANIFLSSVISDCSSASALINKLPVFILTDFVGSDRDVEQLKLKFNYWRSV